MNKKYILGIIGACALIGAFIIINKQPAASPVASKQTVKVGFMLPLSGQFAGLAEGVKNAGMMAVEDYQATHPNITIEIVNEDDGFEPSWARQNYERNHFLLSICRYKKRRMATKSLLYIVSLDVFKIFKRGFYFIS
jgi:hypothetical protein